MLYFYRYFNNLGGRYYASLGNRFISNFRHFTCRIYRFNDFWNKLRKQQDEQQAQIDAAKQVMSMLIIDKKKMKLKDANLPKMVLEQTPKYLRGSKMPIVKAKIGPRIMTLMADPKVFDQLPVKAEVKAEVSGIYITGIKSVRGGKVVAEPAPKKKGLKKFFSKNK